MEIVDTGIKRETGPDEKKYKLYRKNGGELTKNAYRLALTPCYTFKYPFSSLSQAARMLRIIPSDFSKQSRHTIRIEAVKQTYGYLREQPNGECGSWSDEKVFAEALLLQNHFAAYKAFKNGLPNIFRPKK